MASRMESTGQPEKIQLSQSTADMLSRFYPEYKVELRGTVDVKGKEACNTYWLLGRDQHIMPTQEQLQQQQQQVSDAQRSAMASLAM